MKQLWDRSMAQERVLAELMEVKAVKPSKSERDNNEQQNRHDVSRSL